jgi:topoisomerase IA-like protein
LFVAAGQHNENRSKEPSEYHESWSEDDKYWFRENRRQYHKHGGSKYNKLLGVHPDKGGHVDAKYGPFGPYVTHEGEVASLPRGRWPEDITLDEAIALLDAKVKELAAAKSAAKQPTPAQIAKAQKLARE